MSWDSINQDGINLIKTFEGFVASPGPDPIGLVTVGYGHKCTSPDCSEVPYSYPLTKADAEALLRQDLPQFIRAVDSSLKDNLKLNENQRAALTSFTYNMGPTNFKTSTLVKRLNAGEDPNTVAAEELPRWNKAGGKVFAGLVRRREAEVELFKKPTGP
ncbi:hypothetical protein EC973_008413 [Apophysomyces ossiformis]|uniref:Lysozyme n=1 Tax=Apophysomyces ossiformis TaxID=679940 RepID=A0A8H7BTI3_9FUNG|nr:hypothetical protein EC973_008413 [Apophysomyces ossiformis]